MATDRLVLLACFPGMQALDVVGPHEVFAGASRHVDARAGTGRRGAPGRRGYRVELVAAEPGPVVTESGLGIMATRARPRSGTVDTLLVPGGDGVLAARDDPAFVGWVRGAATRSRRVGSVCSGAFVLAEAGLLANCRVTTHWRRAARLAREYPELTVDADPVFTRRAAEPGRAETWTSAGVTAGIDLALAMVEDDHGVEVAQRVARDLVMFLRRPGGQSQFATAVWTDAAEHDGVRRAQQLVRDDPTGDHRVETLAAAVAMSPRHFARRFAAECGDTPARWVERVRVEQARHRLETEPATLAVVAQACGFGSVETLRRAFLRRVGVTPDDYRRRFR